MGVTINRDIRLDSKSEALTRAAPTEATEGVDLSNVYSYRIIVSAPAAATLSGAGTLQAWHYNATTGWARNPDLDLAVSASSVRSQAFADVLLGPPTGRMLFAPASVTTSAGTTVDVRYELEIR